MLSTVIATLIAPFVFHTLSLTHHPPKMSDVESFTPAFPVYVNVYFFPFVTVLTDALLNIKMVSS